MATTPTMAQHILPNIANIINSSFAKSVFSQAWNRGEVVHYLKDVDHEVLSNNLSPYYKSSARLPRKLFCQFNSYLTETNRLTFHESGRRFAQHHSDPSWRSSSTRRKYEYESKSFVENERYFRVTHIGFTVTWLDDFWKPKIEPCGTRWVSVNGSDNDVAMPMHCCLLVR